MMFTVTYMVCRRMVMSDVPSCRLVYQLSRTKPRKLVDNACLVERAAGILQLLVLYSITLFTDNDAVMQYKTWSQGWREWKQALST